MSKNIHANKPVIAVLLLNNKGMNKCIQLIFTMTQSYQLVD